MGPHPHNVHAPPTIKTILVVAACLIVPFVLLCAVITAQWVFSEQKRSLAVAASLSVKAADDLANYLEEQVTILQALGSSPALDDGDFARFEVQVRELLDRAGVGLILRDRSGITRVNTSGLIDLNAIQALRRQDDLVHDLRRPVVSDLIDRQGGKVPLIAIGVPVLRDGEVRYILNASIHPIAITNRLKLSGVEGDYFGSVVDRQGRVLGRSTNNALTIGQVLRGVAERTGERGLWFGEDMHGVPIQVHYRRLPGSGWLVNVGITTAAMHGPLTRSIWLMAGLTLTLVIGAAALTWPMLRRTRAAQQATQDANRVLAEQERRHRTLTEILPQMVWIFSQDTGSVLYANEKFQDFHGRDGQSLNHEPCLYPDDAPRHLANMQAAVTARVPFADEARLRRHDGSYHWHKLMTVPIVTDRQHPEWLGTALDIEDIVVSRGELQAKTDLLLLAQDAAGAAVWDWDLGNDRIHLSPGSARMHGLDIADQAKSVVLTRTQWEAYVVADDLPPLWDDVRRAIDTRSTFVSEFRTRDPSGRLRWVQTFGRVAFDAQTDKPVRFVGLHLDVSARRASDEALRESEAQLRRSEERLALALDSGEDGLFDWDLATDAVWVSKSWTTKLGYADDRPAEHGSVYMAAVHPDDRQELNEHLHAHLLGHTPAFEAEYRRVHADGGYLWVLHRARVVSRDADGRALRLVGTLIDISRRKVAEMHVAHMAHHDALTDLPNRSLFRERLDRALKQAARGPNRYAVLACDLDRFKAVNDTLGHLAGDRLLCIVAERITAVVRPQDTVARLGGDEFAVILSDIGGESAVRTVCERIIAAIDEPIPLDGLSIDIAVSIGVALVSTDTETGEDVFRRADMALYQAKAAGRNTYRLFEAEAQARTVTRSLLAMDMKEAIRRGDFFLMYQPVVDVITGSVVSFEALMRWQHPVHGLISPGDFIPVAEETGMIVPLGSWALKEACREAMSWPEALRVGVNVSAVQFRGGLEEAVLTALASTGLPAWRLKLEVTESVLMQDADGALACLHRLRALGVKIALDDFGTGYSSLSYLRRFPFDKLKIDRAFIRDIADPDAAAIVRAVVGIGERLGMGIVAEGVETEEQLDLVRQEGCTEVQGFLFSRPLPASEARAFIVSPRARAAA